MEYQRIIILLDNTPNQQYKIKTKIWVEINDKSRGKYNKDNQIKFKIWMLRSSLCDYKDAYILVKGIVTVRNKAAQDKPNNSANRKVIFKNCAVFTNL